MAPILFVSGDSNNDGLLQLNETWVYTGSYAITQANIDAGHVTNQALVDSLAPDQSPISDLSDDNSVIRR